MTKEEIINQCISEMFIWSAGSTVNIHISHIYSSNFNSPLKISYQAYPEIPRIGSYREAMSGYGETEIEALQECLERIRHAVKEG